MKVGDLVIYKPHAKEWKGTGLIHAVAENTHPTASRYKISWPAKPAHIGKTMTWEAARNIEVLSEAR